MSEEVRRPLEELMEFEGNQLDVEIFRYYYAQGEKAGYTQGERAGYMQGEKAGHETLRALLIDQLTERFGALPEVARGRLLDASPEVLARWARRVLSAASLDDVLASVP
jgi:flagellar biosynthesis/type III secretory pathway protein FliH